MDHKAFFREYFGLPEASDRFGCLGLTLSGVKDTRWYPIDKAAADKVRAFYKAPHDGFVIVRTRNNRSLAFRPSGLEGVTLLPINSTMDDDVDIPWDGYDGLSVETYAALNLLLGDNDDVDPFDRLWPDAMDEARERYEPFNANWWERLSYRQLVLKSGRATWFWADAERVSSDMLKNEYLSLRTGADDCENVPGNGYFVKTDRVALIDEPAITQAESLGFLAKLKEFFGE